ncbi:MAG: hypothetical protein DRP59_01355 [Spirochaetes bacterium]|nr:MAG: hypothetical protein DRP59_01355 [Spirochaetota bacterium]
MKFRVILFFLISVFASFLFPLDGSGRIYKIKSFPKDAVLILDDSVQKPFREENGVTFYDIPASVHYGFLRAQGYRDKYLDFQQISEETREIKLEKLDTSLIFRSTIGTGSSSQPKSIRFSPDGSYLVAALLHGRGIYIFDFKAHKEIRKGVIPKEYSEKKGFVESLFINRLGELWISQMTTGMIHVLDSKTLAYKMSFPAGGKWSKVIAADPSEKRVYISNWESRTISVVDPDRHSVLRRIEVPGIPRGLALSPDGRYLYAGIYSKGKVVKIDTKTETIVKTIDLGDGAPRHLVISPKKGLLFVSDMYYGTIFTINLKTDKVIRKVYAGSNLNTIALSPDEKYLFVSSRGKNSRNGYLEKGPDFGKIFLYNTGRGRIEDWVWGQNQPTGLDISPDSKTIAFTDFLDGLIEIYNWER